MTKNIDGKLLLYFVEGALLLNLSVQKRSISEKLNFSGDYKNYITARKEQFLRKKMGILKKPSWVVFELKDSIKLLSVKRAPLICGVAASLLTFYSFYKK